VFDVLGAVHGGEDVAVVVDADLSEDREFARLARAERGSLPRRPVVGEYDALLGYSLAVQVGEREAAGGAAEVGDVDGDGVFAELLGDRRHLDRLRSGADDQCDGHRAHQ